MDTTAITTLISGVGFPIAACIALFWSNTKAQEQHKEEMDKMSEAIQNNTLVMQKILDRLDFLEVDRNDKE